MTAVGGKIDRVVGAVTGDDTQERSFRLLDAFLLTLLIQCRARLVKRRDRLRKSKYFLLASLQTKHSSRLNKHV
jgi:hypothetical protein